MRTFPAGISHIGGGERVARGGLRISAPIPLTTQGATLNAAGASRPPASGENAVATPTPLSARQGLARQSPARPGAARGRVVCGPRGREAGIPTQMKPDPRTPEHRSPSAPRNASYSEASYRRAVARHHDVSSSRGCEKIGFIQRWMVVRRGPRAPRGGRRVRRGPVGRRSHVAGTAGGDGVAPVTTPKPPKHTRPHGPRSPDRSASSQPVSRCSSPARRSWSCSW